MKEETMLISHIRRTVLYVIAGLVPLFFLPFTQEFFLTGKMYFLFFGSLTLLLLSAFEFLITKKLVWEKRPYDNVVVLFFIASVLSVLFSSPNKIQAIVNPGFGIMTLFSLLIIYFFLSREKETALKRAIVYFPSIVLASTAVLYLSNPFKNTALPLYLQFLKNPFFSPIGPSIDLIMFLGFAAVLIIARIFGKDPHHHKKFSPLFLGGLVVFLAGIGATVYQIIVSKSLIYPPVNLSWYAAVETLKQPVTALFGVGLDNFSAMFTRVKDIGYNSTSLWSIGSFNLSSSAFLHIITEAGILGGVAFTLMILQLFRSNAGSKKNLLVFGYIVLAALVFPISLTFLFVLFLLLSGVGTQEHTGTDQASVFSFEKIMPLYVVVVVLLFGFIGVSLYFGGRSYAAEVYFKRAIDGFASNNAKYVYDNMRTAVIMNPYIERYRINFSQTNMLIANNVAQQAADKQKKEGGEGQQQPQLTDQQRETIAQAIQAAIDEAKAAVSLNPQKATNWENLASIYRNVINIAQGADGWTISAFQRAIVLDPQNPSYRLNLGGVLFGLQKYDEASRMFEQAIGLKPDWANAYYNYAWASYQKQDYKTAAAAMQSTLSLLDPKRDKADYERATADLKEFRKMLPEEVEATGGATTQPGQLSIPTPAAEPLEPKIELPKEASPEAR